jgi:ribose transport system substrate-binding protein
MMKASASQDPYVMAGMAFDLGYQVFQGETPAETTVLLEPELITADNLSTYQGWTAVR